VRGLINPDPSTSTWKNFTLDGKKDEYECGARSIKDDLKYLTELFPDFSNANILLQHRGELFGCFIFNSSR
jgi:hypothetical protein